MNATAEFVVTRFDHGLMKSVAIAGPFSDVTAAVAEAGRMNHFKRHRDQFLMVDLANFVSAAGLSRESKTAHQPDGRARVR